MVDIQDKKRKEQVRKCGGSSMGKALRLGKSASVFSANIHFNPTYGRLVGAYYLPEGEEMPDVNGFLRTLENGKICSTGVQRRTRNATVRPKKADQRRRDISMDLSDSILESPRSIEPGSPPCRSAGDDSAGPLPSPSCLDAAQLNLTGESSTPPGIIADAPYDDQTSAFDIIPNENEYAEVTASEVANEWEEIFRILPEDAHDHQNTEAASRVLRQVSCRKRLELIGKRLQRPSKAQQNFGQKHIETGYRANRRRFIKSIGKRLKP